MNFIRINKDLLNIVNSYLLPKEMKSIFNKSLLLINNTKNLLYIEYIDKNLNPHIFRKSYLFKFEDSNITFKDDWLSSNFSSI